ncbi:hypothetical protein [Paenibacillus dakarensis]|uniref:hypothetical protein n=1 Tax=Paenibacillus dakarensis TaxID=1527293 RepID=UPI0006D592C7|nr:hypothetical protein [Paenibacillus dakarensis]
MDVAGPETRNVTVLVNVKDAKKLPQTGAYLAKFLSNLTKDHGLFSVNVAASVEPAQETAFGAAQPPEEPTEIEIVFIPEGDD